MALLFDYNFEHQSGNPAFCSDTLRITARLLQTTSPSLTQTLTQLLLQYEIALSHNINNEPTITNTQLLSDLGAVNIHKIITALTVIGNHELVRNVTNNQALLSSLKKIILQWSDFGEWIIQRNQDLY